MSYRVGFVGVGLMGHGIAANILRNGHALAFLEHPGNAPSDDLLAQGARTAQTVEALARDNEVLFLCVTGSAQVEEVVHGDRGALAGAREGLIVVDCSTIEPQVSQRVAAALAERKVHYLDAPMTRTPREAEAGRLNLMVGGDREVFERVEPLLHSFAEHIHFAGPSGAGHALKLLHNFVSLGNCALLAEAAVCAQRSGIDAEVLLDVLANGGGDSTALKRMRPYLLEGDDSALRFSLANAHKDIGYYTRMVDALGVPSVGDGLSRQFGLAVEQGAQDQAVPRLADVLRDALDDG